MKRIWVVLLTALLGIGAVGLLPSCGKYPTYANCTELNKVYKGGVSRKGAVDKRASGTAKYKPYVNDDLYFANKKSDRDSDGIACEQ